MLPAFMMLGFASFGAPLLLSFVLTCIVAVALLGWAFKRGIADPLLRHGLMPIVVATIGLAIAMRNGVRAGYSAEAHPFPSLFADKLFNIAGVTITLSDVGTLALALVLVFATARPSMQKTVTGRAIQAVAQNTDSATVLGINVPRMIFYTLRSSLLACAAALLVTPTYLAKFDMGEPLGTGFLRGNHRRLQQLARRHPRRPHRRRQRRRLAAAYISRRPTRTPSRWLSSCS